MHRNRALAGALLLALSGVAGLSACGDDTEGAGTSTTVTIAATSYVTRQPATTTTTSGGSTGGSTEDSGGTAPGEQLYTVQAGDFLSKIAELYEVDIEELANYNQWPEGVDHPLFEGDVVKIPPGGKVLNEDGEGVTTDPPTDVTDDPSNEPATTDDPEVTTRTTQGQDPCSEGTYEVQAGDFPTGVAQKFDVTLGDLNAANAGTEGYDSFYVGLEIVIPAPSNC